MRVFQTYAELDAAIALPADAPGAFRFLQSFAPAGFRCATCRKVIPFPFAGGGTGYGTDSTRQMHCYACCNARDVESMRDRSGPFCAYLSSDGRHVTSWPGGILGTITQLSESRTGWYGSRLTHVRVRDVHGNYWHGKGAGAGMFIRLHPSKGAR